MGISRNAGVESCRPPRESVNEMAMGLTKTWLT